MTDTDDVRSLLTSRNRPKVHRRDATLKLNPMDIEEQTEENSPELESKIEPVEIIGNAPLQQQQIQQLQEELKKLPEIGKRLAIHLEQEIRTDLLQLCDRQEITPETFVEAAYALLKEKPELVEQIVIDAKKRLKQRKKAGLIRRTLSMMNIAIST